MAFLEDLMAIISIVDDSRLARIYTAACLRKGGHEVEEIEPSSLFDVKKALQASPPDLLIMDFLMPNCAGASLARICLETPELRAMRIVVVTAHHDDEVTARLKAMGVLEVMFKPFEAQDLLDTVSAVLQMVREDE